MWWLNNNESLENTCYFNFIWAAVNRSVHSISLIFLFIFLLSHSLLSGFWLHTFWYAYHTIVARVTNPGKNDVEISYANIHMGEGTRVTKQKERILRVLVNIEAHTHTHSMAIGHTLNYYCLTEKGYFLVGFH